jgi:hypothetical protein
MVSVRAEKSFIRVLNALAELEALSSIDAFGGTEAWVARLQRRLDRYLTLTGHLASHRPALTTELIRAMQSRVKHAVASGDRTAVFATSADLRDELAAHFRSLVAQRPHAP